MFSLTAAGLSGSVLQMINHGISTGALFALVGMLYERYHTREIAALGGLARKLPIMASAFVLFTMSSIGLPLLNGFVGEFLILAGAFQRGWGESSLAPRIDLQVASVLAVLGVVLGAWYMLWLVQRIFFGPLKEPPHDASSAEVRDLSLREIAALAPLALFVFWIGLAPDNFVRSIEEATAAITARTDRLIDPRPPSMTAGRPATASLGLSASIEE
jgi:NADH-quinone oxidoreductase subunit M